MCKDERGIPTGKRQSPGFCEIAKRLLDDFGKAVQAVLALHEQQFLAIVEGDSDAGRFDLLIHEALENKQNAKYAYLSHLDVHGCSSIKQL
jgi:hypothetical protein